MDQPAPKPPEGIPVLKSEMNLEARLKFLAKQLEDIISISNNFVDTGMGSFNIKEFISVCEDVKSRIENYCTTDPSGLEDLKNRMGHLRAHLREAIDVSKKICDEGSFSPTIENFGHTCADFDQNISQCSCFKLSPENKQMVWTKVEAKPVEEPKPIAAKVPFEAKPIAECKHMFEPKYAYQKYISRGVPEYMKHPKPAGDLQTDKTKMMDHCNPMANTRLNEFESHINEVIDMTKFYQSEGLLSGVTEEFLKYCEAIRIKIEDFKNQNVNKITGVFKEEELPSSSIDSLEFRTKLGDKSPSLGSIDKLVSQIDETIELTKEAKQEGLVSGSVDEFIRNCQEIKSKIESRGTDLMEKTEPESQVLNALAYNINDIIKYISKYRDEGLISRSVEKFFKTCQTIKAKIDLYKTYPPGKKQLQNEEPLCGKSCICDKQDPYEEPCDRCLEMFAGKPPSPQELPRPPCNTCQGIEEYPSQDLCQTCFKNPYSPPSVSQDESSSYYESNAESQEKICSNCKRRRKMKKNPANMQIRVKVEESEPTDSSLGYYETKVRKITKIKRYIEKDGQIKEDIETITTKKRKYDPNETLLIEDDDRYVNSYDSIMNDTKRVAVCDVPQAKGFIRTVRHVKSQDLIRATPLVGPSLRQSVSADTLLTKIESEVGHLNLYEMKSYSVLSSFNSSFPRPIP